MPIATPLERLRIVGRRSVRPKVRLNTNRPSLLDPGLRGDLWVLGVNSDLLALRCNYHTLAHLPGTGPDMMSFNSLLFGLRHRYPRKQRRG